jgi:hypothetical protein
MAAKRTRTGLPPFRNTGKWCIMAALRLRSAIVPVRIADRRGEEAAVTEDGLA